jgi:uncharacterized protein DUF547
VAEGARAPRIVTALAVWVAVLLGGARPAPAEPFSHAALDTVLARVLREGRVDYGALAKDHADLDRYLAAVAGARPDPWPREEQIAFWVNAYNARVLDGVIRRPGIKSVLDVRRVLGIPTLGFFRERRATAGAQRSLDDIEHRILRARYAEPRLHFVLNCASVSCPTLPERALTAATLEADLEAATGRFLADSTRNRIDPARGMRLSAIFKWYGEDFRASDGSVQAFVLRHLLQDRGLRSDLPVEFLDYDWALNGSW